MPKPTITPPKQAKSNTPSMGVSMPTGYLDPAKISAAAPGVPDFIVGGVATPQLGGPVTQQKIGAQLGKPVMPTQGAIVPPNEAKMQSMIDGSGNKMGQASQAGAKTPEQNAMENKKWNKLLANMGLFGDG